MIQEPESILKGWVKEEGKEFHEGLLDKIRGRCSDKIRGRCSKNSVDIQLHFDKK